MVLYTLGVPNFFINKIRSVNTDTLAVSMGLRVMNAQGGLHHQWDPLAMGLGDSPPSVARSMNLFYPNVDVPNPTPESPDGGAVYWSFLLVNNGHTDYSTLVGALTTAADQVAGALLGSGNTIAAILGGVIIGTDALVKMLTQGCDGIVAAQNWAWTAAELANMTAGNVNWFSNQNYPGTDSPSLCGGNSNYDVMYEVSSSPVITVPDLYRVPWPKRATSIANQAGFALEILRQSTSTAVDEATVTGQYPYAGSIVPQGTTLEVIVTWPFKAGGGHENP